MISITRTKSENCTKKHTHTEEIKDKDENEE